MNTPDPLTILLILVGELVALWILRQRGFIHIRSWFFTITICDHAPPDAVMKAVKTPPQSSNGENQ